MRYLKALHQLALTTVIGGLLVIAGCGGAKGNSNPNLTGPEQRLIHRQRRWKQQNESDPTPTPTPTATPSPTPAPTATPNPTGYTNASANAGIVSSGGNGDNGWRQRRKR